MHQIKTGKFLYPADHTGDSGAGNRILLKTVYFICYVSILSGGSKDRRSKRTLFVPQDRTSDHVSGYCNNVYHGIYRKLE